MVILPIPFGGYCGIGFSGMGGAIDRLLCIDGRTVGMARHMRSCDGLTGSTRRRTRSRIRSDIPRGSMRIKRRHANSCHRKYAGLEPALERFDCQSWAMIVGKLL